MTERKNENKVNTQYQKSKINPEELYSDEDSQKKKQNNETNDINEQIKGSDADTDQQVGKFNE